MQKAIGTMLLMLVLFTTAFACGAPTPVNGHIESRRSPYLMLFVDGIESPIYITKANAFGYFAFGEVTPCVTYRLDAFGRGEDFESITFLVTGNGIPIWLEVQQEARWIKIAKHTDR